MITAAGSPPSGAGCRGWSSSSCCSGSPCSGHTCPGSGADTYAQSIVAQSLAMAVIFLSFVVVTGMGGMVSLAQATFVTAGGMGAGWALTHNWGIDVPFLASHGQLNFVWAALIGIVVAAAIGAMIALASSRLGTVYLAIWSLAAAFFFALVVFAWDPIGNGQSGWIIRGPTLYLPGFDWVHHLLTGESGPFDFNNIPDQILLFAALFGLITLVIHNVMRSATGRAMLAVRSSKVAAQASGIRAERTKIKIFALSAGIAGLGGVLLSLFLFASTDTTAPPYVGLFWLVLVVTFGIRRPGGALLAGFAFAVGTPVFHWFASTVLPGGTVNVLVSSIYFVPMLSGLGAIGLAQEPDGILTYFGQRNLKKRKAKERSARIAQVEALAGGGVVPEHERSHVTLGIPPDPQPACVEAALLLNGVVAGYGDTEVLHGVTLSIHSGTVVALLGANGAGKSTLCRVASGLIAPFSGLRILRWQGYFDRFPS